LVVETPVSEHGPGDEERLRELIEAAIEAKEVKRFKAFKASVKGNAKRKAKASKVSGSSWMVCGYQWALQSCVVD
jgi:hypothetical protein